MGAEECVDDGLESRYSETLLYTCVRWGQGRAHRGLGS